MLLQKKNIFETSKRFILAKFVYLNEMKETHRVLGKMFIFELPTN